MALARWCKLMVMITTFVVQGNRLKRASQDEQTVEPLALMLMAKTSPASAFSVGAPHQRPSGSSLTAARAAPQVMGLSRRALLQSVAAAGIAVAAGVSPSYAGVVSEQDRRNAFSSLGPLIERGRDYWSGRLPKLIASKDWKTLADDTKNPTTTNKQGGYLVNLPLAMKIWAGTGLVGSLQLGEKVDSESMAKGYVFDIIESIEDIKLAAGGLEPGGPFAAFGGTVEIPESKRIELATEAQKRGAEAFKEYIKLSNKFATPVSANWVPMEEYPE